MSRCGSPMQSAGHNVSPQPSVLPIPSFSLLGSMHQQESPHPTALASPEPQVYIKLPILETHDEISFPGPLCFKRLSNQRWSHKGHEHTLRER
jgi:hypothetical protein